MDNIPLIYSIFIIFFPVTVIFACTPYIGKKGAFFGVILPPEAQNDATVKKICRRYTIFSVAAGVSLAATCFVLNAFSAVILCAIVMIGICCTMFTANNRLIRNIIAVNDYENLQKPVYIKNITSELKPQTITAFWLFLLLPPVAVTVFDAYKNSSEIWYWLPIIQSVIIMLCIAAFFVLKNAGQYASKNNAENDMKRNIIVRRKLSAMIFLISLILCVFIMFMQLCATKTFNIPYFISAAPFVTTVLITVCAVAFCFKINKL